MGTSCNEEPWDQACAVRSSIVSPYPEEGSEGGTGKLHRPRRAGWLALGSFGVTSDHTLRATEMCVCVCVTCPQK